METTPTGGSRPPELPIIGGHLALDFANSVNDPLGPEHHDHVSTYAALVDWSISVGSITEEQGESLRRRAGRRTKEAEAVLHSAHGLRGSLNEVFAAVAGGSTDLSSSWPRLRGFVVEAQAHAELGPVPGGLQQWSWPEVDDLAVVLHPVASAAADLLVSDDLSRVKQCARCPWVFLDHSKNHSRRWCDMDSCGRAQKIERYVARRAAGRRGAR